MVQPQFFQQPIFGQIGDLSNLVMGCRKFCQFCEEGEGREDLDPVVGDDDCVEFFEGAEVVDDFDLVVVEDESFEVD